MSGEEPWKSLRGWRAASHAPASGIILSDLLPDGVGFVSAVPSQGICANLAGSLTCAVGSLASGASASVTIVARAGAVGLMTNLLTVAGDQFDQAPGNNLALAVNNIVPAADVSL